MVPRLQQSERRSNGDGSGRLPLHFAFQSVVESTVGVAGEHHEGIGVARIQLFTGLYLERPAPHVEHVGVRTHAVVEPLRLVADLEIQVRLRTELDLARQQRLAQIEAARLVAASERYIDTGARVQLARQRSIAAPQIVCRAKIVRRVRVADDVLVAGRATFRPQTDRPSQLTGQIAVDLAEDCAGARLVMAVRQRCRNGRNGTARRGVEEYPGTVVVKSLAKLLSVDSHQPAQTSLVRRAQPCFQAVGGALAVLHIGVGVRVRSPQDGIAPIAIEAVFREGVRVGANDSQRRGADTGVGKAHRAAGRVL